MILLANFLNSIAVILDIVLNFVFLLVIARVVISWLNADPYNPIVSFIRQSTDPLFRFTEPIQKIIPLNIGSLDLSPIILLLIISFLRTFVVQSIFDYSNQMKRAQIIQEL